MRVIILKHMRTLPIAAIAAGALLCEMPLRAEEVSPALARRLLCINRNILNAKMHPNYSPYLEGASLQVALEYFFQFEGRFPYETVNAKETELFKRMINGFITGEIKPNQFKNVSEETVLAFLAKQPDAHKYGWDRAKRVTKTTADQLKPVPLPEDATPYELETQRIIDQYYKEFPIQPGEIKDRPGELRRSPSAVSDTPMPQKRGPGRPPKGSREELPETLRKDGLRSANGQHSQAKGILENTITSLKSTDPIWEIKKDDPRYTKAKRILELLGSYYRENRLNPADFSAEARPTVIAYRKFRIIRDIKNYHGWVNKNAVPDPSDLEHKIPEIYRRLLDSIDQDQMGVEDFPEHLRPFAGQWLKNAETFRGPNTSPVNKGN